MTDWQNLPEVDLETIARYEAEARRLRAQALRDMVAGAGAWLRRHISYAPHGAAQPSK